MLSHNHECFFLALLSLGVFLSVSPVASKSLVPISSHGFDFQVGAFPNFATSDLQLVVGTLPDCDEQQTSFIIESLSGVIHNGTTSSSNPVYVSISSDFITSSSGFSDRQKGIHVYSTGEYPISVLVVNYGNLTYGEYLAYPLGQADSQTYTYYAISTNADTPNMVRSVILLVARDNDTLVKVTSPVLFLPPSDAQAPSDDTIVTAGITHSFVLHSLQTFLITTYFDDDDMTGTKIESDKPLNVISGNECGFVPTPAVLNCDHLSEQMPPTSSWGTEFLLIPFAGHTDGQFHKVVSSQSHTMVFCSCVCSEQNAMNFTLASAGNHHQFYTNSSTYCYLNATKPILIAQLQPGAMFSSSTNELGDPTLTILPALEHYPNEVNAIPLSYTAFREHFINIAVTENSVLLDNTLIPADQWTQIQHNGEIVGYGVQLSVSAAPVHHVRHTNPMSGVGVMAYGLGTLISYSYIAGINLEEGRLNTIEEECLISETITPTPSSSVINESPTLTSSNVDKLASSIVPNTSLLSFTPAILSISEEPSQSAMTSEIVSTTVLQDNPSTTERQLKTMTLSSAFSSIMVLVETPSPSSTLRDEITSETLHVSSMDISTSEVATQIIPTISIAVMNSPVSEGIIISSTDLLAIVENTSLEVINIQSTVMTSEIFNTTTLQDKTSITDVQPTVSIASSLPLNPASLVTEQTSTAMPTPSPSICPPFSNNSNQFKIRLGVADGRNYLFIAARNLIDERFMDVLLSANAESWVAVGFTTTRSMGEADVLVCIRNTDTDNVNVVDAWNPLPNYEHPVADDSQVGLCHHESYFKDGRISCRFSRFIDVINEGQDLNIYSELYQMYGAGDTLSQGTKDYSLPISIHEEIPDITYSTISIANSSSAFILPSKELTRVHGVLMFLAWPLAVVCGIFMTAWMRPALPRGEWFEFHWNLMVASLFLSFAGLVSIILANFNNPDHPGLVRFSCAKSTAHFSIGLLVLTLQFLTAFLSACRCHPTSKYHWIFSVLHTCGGITAEVFGLINAGLGISLIQTECNTTGSWALWVYGGFVAFQIIFQLSLLLGFTITALKSKDPKDRMNQLPSAAKYVISCLSSLQRIKSDPLENLKSKKKKSSRAKSSHVVLAPRASKDSSLRWIALSVFVPVTLGFVLAVVIISIVTS